MQQGHRADTLALPDGARASKPTGGPDSGACRWLRPHGRQLGASPSAGPWLPPSMAASGLRGQQRSFLSLSQLPKSRAPYTEFTRCQDHSEEGPRCPSRWQGGPSKHRSHFAKLLQAGSRPRGARGTAVQGSLQTRRVLQPPSSNPPQTSWEEGLAPSFPDEDTVAQRVCRARAPVRAREEPSPLLARRVPGLREEQLQEVVSSKRMVLEGTLTVHLPHRLELVLA